MIPAKTAEPIQMQYGMLSRVGPGNHDIVLDKGAHWRNRANMLKPPDAVLSQKFYCNHLFKSSVGLCYAVCCLHCGLKLYCFTCRPILKTVSSVA